MKAWWKHVDEWVPPTSDDEDQIHVIPVPPELTVEDAWCEIVMFGQLHRPLRWWQRRRRRDWRWAVIRMLAGGDPIRDFEVIGDMD